MKKVCKNNHIYEYFPGNKRGCRQCRSMYNKSWRSANKNLVKELNKNWKTNNKERVCELNKKSREKHLEVIHQKQRLYYLRTSEKHKERNKKYHKNNPEVGRAKSAKRRAAKIQSMPSWLSKIQKEEINQFYKDAQDISWLSEGGLEVDHIVPLQSKKCLWFTCSVELTNNSNVFK